ncbi:RND transporter [Nocardioides dubius]|uniref:Membrane transport protein MMPL domain-containing protein n=1 Tax=Nocardioides dubius TaxID=317019 RepID=A0ABN1U2T1_9ACTN
MTVRSTLRQPAALARVLLVVAVLGLVGLGLSRAEIDTGISSFVPNDDDSYAATEQRDQDFGADPIVVLLHGSGKDGLLIDGEQLRRLVGLEGELAQLPDVAVVYGPGTVLNQTAKSVRNVILQISGARDSIENSARAQAKAEGLSGAARAKRVDAAVAEFDERYGALVAQAMPMGLPSLSNSKFVASVLFGDDGEPRSEWRFLAPTAKSATLLIRPRAGLDQAGTRQLVGRVTETVDAAGLETRDPVVTGLPVVTSAVAERATDEAPRLGLLAIGAVAAVLFLMPWTRRRRDRLRPLVVVALGTATTLALFGALGRPMSLGVIAFLPIVLGIGSDFPIYLARGTSRRTVLSAAAGAALAFACLALSPLPFVREFGLALALGVVCTLAWGLVLLGWLRGADTDLDMDADVDGDDRGRAGADQRDAAPPRSRPSRRLTAGLCLAAAVAAVAGWIALPSLSIESRADRLAAGLPELEDARTAEQTLGFASEITVVVRGKSVLTPEVLAWAAEAESVLLTRHADVLRPLLTMNRLLEFLGATPTQTEIEAGSALLPSYLLEAVIGDGGEVGALTFGLAVDDVAEQRRLVEEIRAELPAAPKGTTVELVGLPVIAGSGLDAVNASRWTIGVVGIALAAIAVGVGLRSRRMGLLVACSAVLAAGWVYLAILLSGANLNPLTMAVAALVTVTACEFTVMLGHPHAQGRRLQRAVIVAVSAATLGYLALTLSDLAVIRSFGWVLAGGVLASCVASWLVTTAAAVLWPSSQRTGAAEAVGTGERAMEKKKHDEREVVPCS